MSDQPPQDDGIPSASTSQHADTIVPIRSRDWMDIIAESVEALVPGQPPTNPTVVTAADLETHRAHQEELNAEGSAGLSSRRSIRSFALPSPHSNPPSAAPAASLSSASFPSTNELNPLISLNTARNFRLPPFPSNFLDPTNHSQAPSTRPTTWASTSAPRGGPPSDGSSNLVNSRPSYSANLGEGWQHWETVGDFDTFPSVGLEPGGGGERYPSVGDGEEDEEDDSEGDMSVGSYGDGGLGREGGREEGSRRPQGRNGPLADFPLAEFLSNLRSPLASGGGIGGGTGLGGGAGGEGNTTSWGPLLGRAGGGREESGLTRLQNVVQGLSRRPPGSLAKTRFRTDVGGDDGTGIQDGLRNGEVVVPSYITSLSLPSPLPPFPTHLSPLPFHLPHYLSLSSPSSLTLAFRPLHAPDDRFASSARSSVPIPRSLGLFYFEVTIVDAGESGYIGIGLCQEGSDLEKLPGWEAGSIGYHGDDGNLFVGSGKGTAFGDGYSTGDVIGVLADYSANTVTFTKNGKTVSTTSSPQLNMRTKDLYPTVGLRTPREVIRCNFGQSDFRFDVDSYLAQRRREMTALVFDPSKPILSSRSLRPPPAQSTASSPTTGLSSHHKSAKAKPSTSSRKKTVDVDLAVRGLIEGYLAQEGYGSTLGALRQTRPNSRSSSAAALLLSSDAPSASTSTSTAPSSSSPFPSTDFTPTQLSLLSSAQTRTTIQTLLTSDYLLQALAAYQAWRETLPASLRKGRANGSEDGMEAELMACCLVSMMFRLKDEGEGEEEKSVEEMTSVHDGVEKMAVTEDRKGKGREREPSTVEPTAAATLKRKASSFTEKDTAKSPRLVHPTVPSSSSPSLNHAPASSFSLPSPPPDFSASTSVSPRTALPRLPPTLLPFSSPPHHSQDCTLSSILSFARLIETSLPSTQSSAILPPLLSLLAYLPLSASDPSSPIEPARPPMHVVRRIFNVRDTDRLAVEIDREMKAVEAMRRSAPESEGEGEESLTCKGALEEAVLHGLAIREELRASGVGVFIEARKALGLT